MRTLLILLLLFSSTTLAEVYKRTNPDGSVEFTDVPSKQNEEPVPLSPMSTFKAPQQTLPQNTGSDDGSQATEAYAYSELRITSPIDDSAIRNNAGNITVNVSLTPGLQSGHTLVLLVDGAKKGESATGSFALSNLDRGSHSLTAQVVDKDGTAIISSTAVTVHLQRASVIRR
jgi:hypothetical protein